CRSVPSISLFTPSTTAVIFTLSLHDALPIYELNLTDRDRFELAWIIDFPFYEWDEDNKKLDFAHNPFSMPQGGLEALETQDPLRSEEHTSELQSRENLVCRLLLEKKNGNHKQ